jgi:hypothetical protein
MRESTQPAWRGSRNRRMELNRLPTCCIRLTKHGTEAVLLLEAASRVGRSRSEAKTPLSCAANAPTICLRRNPRAALLYRAYSRGSPNFLDGRVIFMVYFAPLGEMARVASRLRFLFGFPPEWQDTLMYGVSRGSHRKAVHKHATLYLRPSTNGISLSHLVVRQHGGGNP